MTAIKDATNVRSPDKPIEPIFLERWSPRAMSGQALTEGELLTVLEAARWAPSTYNEQEWRFVYAKRDTAAFDTFFSLLAEANQTWCHRAAVLMVVLSHEVFEKNGKPNPVHTLDAGLAVQNLLLQTAALGLVGHGMAGFNQDEARSKLSIPDDYSVECMIALGRPGSVDELPAELREREQPSDRKPVSAFAFEGQFPA